MSGLRERWLSEGKEHGIAQGIEQGIEQGLERGLEQGIEQGERSLLYRQLTRRFGPLDQITETRLQQATSDDLERWADNILDADTLDEVFAR